MTPTWNAALDLVALFSAWAGTAMITLKGAPALVGTPVTFGGQDITFGNQPVIFGHTPDSKAARLQYLWWARRGMILITLSVVWQATKPCCVLLNAVAKGFGSRP